MSAENSPVTFWGGMAAPNLEDFQGLIAHAYSELPAEIRALCKDFTIKVDDFADEGIVDLAEIDSIFDIFIFFQDEDFEDLDLDDRGLVAVNPNQQHVIWLYRRALLDYWIESEEALGAVIIELLLEELSAYFELTDETETEQ